MRSRRGQLSQRQSSVQSNVVLAADDLRCSEIDVSGGQWATDNGQRHSFGIDGRLARLKRPRKKRRTAKTKFFCHLRENIIRSFLLFTFLCISAMSCDVLCECAVLDLLLDCCQNGRNCGNRVTQRRRKKEAVSLRSLPHPS